MKLVKHLPDLYVATGNELNSNAALIVSGDYVFLVDGMASRKDAEALQHFIINELKKQVAYIACTHYFSDHMAVFPLMKQTPIIAHQKYMHTFASEAFLSEEERSRFVPPSITFSHSLSVQWGAYTLKLFHNPGHTLSNICIDIPEADIIITGDQTVGNIVYLYYSTPAMIRKALLRIKASSRKHILTGHGGISS